MNFEILKDMLQKFNQHNTEVLRLAEEYQKQEEILINNLENLLNERG